MIRTSTSRYVASLVFKLGLDVTVKISEETLDGARSQWDDEPSLKYKQISPEILLREVFFFDLLSHSTLIGTVLTA